jgi:hypothetical protein
MRRTTLLATSLLLALSGLLVSCGGGDDSATPTTAAPSEESPATDGSDDPGGSTQVEAFCAIDTRLNDEVFADIEQQTELTDEQVALLEEAKATAPPEIQAQVTAIIDSLLGQASAPADDPEFAQAGSQIDTFVSENCG